MFWISALAVVAVVLAACGLYDRKRTTGRIDRSRFDSVKTDAQLYAESEAIARGSAPRGFGGGGAF